MEKKVIFILVLLLSSASGFTQNLLLRGTYKGKNVFVKNTGRIDSLGLSTKEVYVNNRLLLTDPQQQVYEVDLSYLNLNDTFLLSISYIEGRKPKILNPMVVKRDFFKLKGVEQKKTYFTYTTVNEKPNEQYKINVHDEKGELIDSMVFDSKAKKKLNTYKVEIHEPEEYFTYDIFHILPNGTTEKVYQIYYPLDRKKLSNQSQTYNEY